MDDVCVSIITPFYKGNRYMQQLIECVSRNAKTAENYHIELVIVNDSPGVEPEYDATWIKDFDLHIVNNVQNMGILRSRAEGVRNARGQYVIMLDQDDLLSDNAVKTQMLCIDDGDIVVGNGLDQNPNNEGAIYKSRRQQEKVLEKRFYYTIGNLIVSPGQVMIRKDIIPDLWLKSDLKQNGSDDLLLWLILLNGEYKWRLNYHSVYVHIYTGENVSSDLEKMVTSSMEVLDILEINHMISESERKRCVKRFNMRKRYEGQGMLRKIMAYACYPGLALEMVKYKYKR